MVADVEFGREKRDEEAVLLFCPASVFEPKLNADAGWAGGGAFGTAAPNKKAPEGGAKVPEDCPKRDVPVLPPRDEPPEGAAPNPPNAPAGLENDPPEVPAPPNADWTLPPNRLPPLELIAGWEKDENWVAGWLILAATGGFPKAEKAFDGGCRAWVVLGKRLPDAAGLLPKIPEALAGCAADEIREFP